MTEMVGDCGVCLKKDTEIKHYSHYVTGSEGVWLCMTCRIAVTGFLKSMMSAAFTARMETVKMMKKR